MAMVQCAEVRKSDGVVLNVILCDDADPFETREGTILVDDPKADAQVGFIYDSGTGDFGQPPDPRARSDIEASKIAAIKAECGYRITASVPEWKQCNLARRKIALLESRIGSGKRASTPRPETAEMAEMEATTNWIDEMRLFSNALEASLSAMTDEELLHFDPAAKTWPLPPAPGGASHDLTRASDLTIEQS